MISKMKLYIRYEMEENYKKQKESKKQVVKKQTLKDVKRIEI